MTHAELLYWRLIWPERATVMESHANAATRMAKHGYRLSSVWNDRTQAYQLAWVKLPDGPRGGKKWQNTDSGKVVYAATKPGSTKERIAAKTERSTHEGVASVLAGHDAVELLPHQQTQAKRALAAIRRHHGDRALDRVEDLARQDVELLRQTTHKGRRDTLLRRLEAYRMMAKSLLAESPKKGGNDGEERADAQGVGRTDAVAPEAGGPVEGETPKSPAPAANQERGSEPEPAGKGASRRIPVSQEVVNKRIDRFEKLFQSRGQHQAADWMRKLREHINAVGGEAAIASLGEELRVGKGSDVQYAGVDTEESPNWASMGHFIESYLNRQGIIPLTGQPVDPSKPILSSQTNMDAWESRDEYLATDFNPVDTPYNDKLEESKDLPGLESSEDVSVVMGRDVTHVTPDVMAKMDEVYGPGKWLIKTYSPDNAFAGFGIYFPQRIAQIAQDARNTIWTSGGELAKYGFSHLRDESGKIVGIQHTGGDRYLFGSPEYDKTIQGDARHWADQAAAAADHERGAMLPNGGKQFMVQPAFPVVGVSEEERAAGKTIAPGEGRVHVLTTGDGKVRVIPHSTWIKGDHLPVVFESEDTKAMAKAAEDAINKLPEKARKGQVYAPDIVKTADGYRVVELNASVEYGGSGYLSDNPFIIDAYVSNLTGRTPGHVRFIQKLLSKRDGTAQAADSPPSEAQEQQRKGESAKDRREESAKRKKMPTPEGARLSFVDEFFAKLSAEIQESANVRPRTGLASEPKSERR